MNTLYYDKNWIRLCSLFKKGLYQFNLEERGINGKLKVFNNTWLHTRLELREPFLGDKIP